MFQIFYKHHHVQDNIMIIERVFHRQIETVSRLVPRSKEKRVLDYSVFSYVLLAASLLFFADLYPSEDERLIHSPLPTKAVRLEIKI